MYEEIIRNSVCEKILNNLDNYESINEATTDANCLINKVTDEVKNFTENNEHFTTKELNNFISESINSYYPALEPHIENLPSVHYNYFCKCNECSLNCTSQCPRNNILTTQPIQNTVLNTQGEKNMQTTCSNNVDTFAAIANALAVLYRRKNEAYGDSFSKSVSKYGKIAALTRMSDKWNRLENLMLNNAEANDESVNDTLLDLASYCIMTVMATNEKTDITDIIKKMEG